MAILLTAETRILLHGMGDGLGRFQCGEMLRYGTRLVGLVEPDRTALPGDLPADLPVFGRAADAVPATGADLGVVFAPGLATRSMVSEMLSAGLATVVCFSEDVPLHDMLTLRHQAREAGARLVGPSSSGIYSPRYGKAGFFVRELCLPGRIGVVTKSGSLGYAVLGEMKASGLGISTIVSTGGEPVKGMNLVEPVSLFCDDVETDAIVVLGEVGGDEEEELAEHVVRHGAKPIVAYIAGRSVAPGQNLGHAGAIVGRHRGSYRSKARALTEAGVHVAEDFGGIVHALLRLTSGTGAEPGQPAFG